MQKLNQDTTLTTNLVWHIHPSVKGTIFHKNMEISVKLLNTKSIVQFLL